ncbi:thiamine pyrophosphokinase, partial [Micromonospora harpali]
MVVMKVPVDGLQNKLTGYLRRRKVTDLPGVTAVARIDRRTKRLTKRLRPGEIAIIDHVDVDRVSAEALVACGAAGVVNVAAGISGRYPNLGPQIIVDAGVPFIDNASPELFERIKDGDLIRLHEGVVYLDDEVVGKGDVQTPESVESAMT